MERTSGLTGHNYLVYPGEHCIFRCFYKATDSGVETNHCELVLRERIWEQWRVEGA
jgi:hypothetical protein